MNNKTLKILITVALLGLMLALSLLPSFAQDALPSSTKLDINRLTHVYQTWNNCGGATLTMGLSYFGFPNQQETPRRYLKPNNEDQNVSPWQMEDFVNNQASDHNVRALTRRGGDQETLKALLAADFPVIIEKGYEVADVEGWMGHYLLLIGYDDAQAAFLTYDSYLGHGNLQGRVETYAYINEFWRHFNQTFIVLYAPAREAEVQQILGDLWDEEAGWRRAWDRASAEAVADPSDVWAWFNLGEAAVGMGEYAVAAQAFDVALNDLGGLPWRLLWYLHGPFEAYYQTGQFAKVEEHARNLQRITPYIEEANYYRGLSAAAQGNTQEALNRLNEVLAFNTNFYPAREARDAIQAGTFITPAAQGG